MDITGSDLSKQAADMILLDDNFVLVVPGVEQGILQSDKINLFVFSRFIILISRNRLIFLFTAYTMITKIPEAAPFVVIIVGNNN